MNAPSVSNTVSKPIFAPPAYDSPHVVRQLEEIVGRVTEVVSQVWPLRDYVAINPYAGLSSRTFADARAFLNVFSDCDLLMPLGYYHSQYEKGQFTLSDVHAAIAEMADEDMPVKASAEQILQRMRASNASEAIDRAGPDGGGSSATAYRPIRTLAEHADQISGTQWNETITDQIGQFCASYYDQTQASWRCPWKDQTLYRAWCLSSRYNFEPELLGLKGFRKFVQALPPTPQAAITHLLSLLEIPTALWESFLLCQVFSMPGWHAWAKHCDQSENEADREHLISLLAIRLAYDVALAQTTGLAVKWEALIDEQSASFRPQVSHGGSDASDRLVLLRASEIAFRNRLVGQLDLQSKPASGRKLAQMVFCIDVRSERIRRQLESLSPELETFGFAGFFGMPIEYVSLGSDQGSSNVPALIRPAFRLFEGDRDGNQDRAASLAAEIRRQGVWKSLWKQFAKSAVGCFSFVETTGLAYATKLFGGNVPSGKTEAPSTAPTFCGLDEQGVTLEARIDLAASMLTNLGLTDGMARFVVLCGHGSKTANNPLAAGLDCGACGGHSGESNARFAALLLNDSDVRSGLAERGIEIPHDTYFMGGLHNTTTDRIELFEWDRVPPSHRKDLEQLMDFCEVAGANTRQERAAVLSHDGKADVFARAADWSEVRPEWGLSGNAAFIVGPRSMTKSSNLDGRVFLHSYDSQADPQGAVLENIMTAPMVVAHWINMQYYASTVDNRHFGSGDKTIHNVVGGFGIFSGNGGDLMTGLPIQSLHDGESYQHLPVRLQVVLAAERDKIKSIIDKHESLQELVDNDWLHLTAVEGGRAFRYVNQGWVLSGADCDDVSAIQSHPSPVAQASDAPGGE